MERERFDELLERCLDGEATAEESAELEQALRADRELRGVLVERSLLEVQLQKVYLKEAPLAEAVKAPDDTAPVLPRRAAGRVRRFQNAPSVQRPPGRFFTAWAPLTAVATVVLGVALWWSLSSHSTPPTQGAKDSTEPPASAAQAVARAVSGSGSVQRGGGTHPTGVSEPLFPGDRLSTSAGARFTFRFEDASTVETNGGSEWVLHAPGEGKRLTLDRGEVFVSVAKQPTAAAFVIHTAAGDASAEGTAFEVSVTGQKTEVRVSEGRVRFGSSSAKVLLAAGEFSAAQPGGAPSAPLALALARIAPWRQGASAPAPVPQGLRNEILVNGDFPPSSAWDLRQDGPAPEFSKSGVRFRLSPAGGEGSTDLRAKEAMELGAGQTLRVSFSAGLRSKTASWRLSLFDADDPRPGSTPHLELGNNSVFSDFMLARRVYPDAPLNRVEDVNPIRFAHGRIHQPAPPGSESSIELSITPTQVTLKVEGVDRGTFEHQCAFRRLRLAFQGNLHVGKAKPDSEVEIKDLKVVRETK